MKVSGTVRHAIGRFEVAIGYVNDQSQPVEMTFEFGLPGAVVTGFEVEKDGKVLRGECKDAEAAFDKYDNTIASGGGAYLLNKKGFSLFCFAHLNLIL